MRGGTARMTLEPFALAAVTIARRLAFVAVMSRPWTTSFDPNMMHTVPGRRESADPTMLAPYSEWAPATP